MYGARMVQGITMRWCGVPDHWCGESDTAWLHFDEKGRDEKNETTLGMEYPTE